MDHVIASQMRAQNVWKGEKWKKMRGHKQSESGGTPRNEILDIFASGGSWFSSHLGLLILYILMSFICKWMVTRPEIGGSFNKHTVTEAVKNWVLEHVAAETSSSDEEINYDPSKSGPGDKLRPVKIRNVRVSCHRLLSHENVRPSQQGADNSSWHWQCLCRALWGGWHWWDIQQAFCHQCSRELPYFLETIHEEPWIMHIIK